jgi:hypothetical protein
VDDFQRPNNSPTDNLNAFKVSAPVVVGSIRTTMRARTLTSHVPIEVSNIRTPAGMKTTRPIIATDFEKDHKELCKNSWRDEYAKLETDSWIAPYSLRLVYGVFIQIIRGC